MDKQILSIAKRYLEREIHLRDFQQEFAALYFQVRRGRDRKQPASILCDRIVGPLAEYSSGHRSEDSFREELASAIRPFAGQPKLSEVRS